MAVIASVVERGSRKGKGAGRCKRTVEGDSTSERGSSSPCRTRVLQVLETIHSRLRSIDRACAPKFVVLRGRAPGPAGIGNNFANNGQVKAKRIFGIGAKRLLSPSLPWCPEHSGLCQGVSQTPDPPALANQVGDCCHVCMQARQVRKHAGPTWCGWLPNGSA